MNRPWAPWLFSEESKTCTDLSRGIVPHDRGALSHGASGTLVPPGGRSIQDHPPDDVLGAFLVGELAPTDVARLDQHLDACGECRELLTSLARDATVPPPIETDETRTQRRLRPGDLLRPGEMLVGRYKLGRLVGRGGMGIVFLATDLLLDRRVCVKVISPAAKSFGGERLEREFQVSRRMQHPNICRLFELGSAGEFQFLTMEYIDGETLEERLSRGSVPASVALRILLATSDALHHAHCAGVIHRDLKPSNVMIRTDGDAVVLDFGLAKDLSGASTEGRMQVGTPGYWAPEQVRGDRATYRSDIYSLGVLAFRLFSKEKAPASGPLPLSRVPRRYRRVVARATAPHPDARFATALDLRRALEHAASRTFPL